MTILDILPDEVDPVVFCCFMGFVFIILFIAFRIIRRTELDRQKEYYMDYRDDEENLTQ
jgi:cbb3-type cytochrome oxidase subunit 3